eukprot:TRINITY_DN1080_c0_g1_i1.p3 TRINITY_DN1080_c0_g1~~TRINITY_DN1080_c0_g1_i1.p3  ORF type:complete len:154 (-),score=47.06 TRINITY_DN1080_c0_g1_i1:820-1281(-)
MDDLEVERGESGASLTFPQEAGQLKKGDYVNIKGRPTKVVEITTSKTGKHGHAKAHIIGIDIFTGKKLEENSPSTHTVDCPRVTKVEQQVIDVHDGQVVTLDDSGEEAQFPLPSSDLGETIQKKFDDGVEIIITVISAMDETHVIAVKDDTKA